jgi:hypothetical protein
MDSIIREFSTSQGARLPANTIALDKLNTILNKGGCSDHSIIAGVRLTHRGYQKLALQMNVDLETVQFMVNQLMTKLRSEKESMSEDYEHFISEDNQRFSMEKDFLGNVTLRDDYSGDEKFLQGSEATEFLNDMGGSDDDQEIIAHYMQNSVTEEAIYEDDEPTYDDELDNDYGTYNFPWKIGNQHGTGTMEYSGKGRLKIVSARDDEGDEMELSNKLVASLTPIAIAFIGNA